MKTALQGRSGRTLARIAYHAVNLGREAAPQIWFRRRLPGLLADWRHYGEESLRPRLDYYFQLREPWSLGADAVAITRIPRASSRYYFDLREHTRYFPPSFRMSFVFGDVTWSPDTPSVVKSRPVGGGARTSILFKLNKFRHFYFPRDPTPFRDKLHRAVWRGNAHTPDRIAFLERFLEHPRIDVGDVRKSPPVGPRVGFLRPQEQMAYRYILSLEGNDVASSLKWTLGSNSLCLMPIPSFETWFMEGQLQPGRHFVAVRPDFGDLEEKIDHYEAHPAEAEEIVRESSRWVQEFQDPRKERLLSLLVLYRYFVGTGQLEPDPALSPLVPDSLWGPWL